MTVTEKTLPNALHYKIQDRAWETLKVERQADATAQREARTRRRAQLAADLCGAIRDRLGLEVPEDAVRWTPATDGLGVPLAEDEPFPAGHAEPKPYVVLDGLFYRHAYDMHSDLVVAPPCFDHPDRPAIDQTWHVHHNTAWLDLGAAYEAFANRTAEPCCGECQQRAYEKAEALAAERYEAERAAKAQRAGAPEPSLGDRLGAVIAELVAREVAAQLGHDAPDE